MSYKTYTAYGHQDSHQLGNVFLGFNGEALHSKFNGYLLGSGYRIFSPIQMRFLSPDSSSPFEEGGINAYAYCGGDPVNYTDPTGKSRLSNFLQRFIPKTKRRATQNASHLASNNSMPQAMDTKRRRNFLTLKELSKNKDINTSHYNDYSDEQLIEKARRFNELLLKEDTRIKATSVETSRHFQAVSRYRNNLDALTQQMSMRHPDYVYRLARQKINFWDKSSSEISLPSATASTGLLHYNQDVKRIRLISI